MLNVILIILLSLAWGSFLNVVAHRIVFEKKLFTFRSVCPQCNKTIFWYDNIPILSYLILGGKCRYCKNLISFLYPLIEILSGIIFTLLFFKFLMNMPGVSTVWFIGYFLFFSALIISVRTDLEALVVPQIFTLWLVPIGVLFSYLGFTEVNFHESVFGAIFGYALLYFVGTLFKYLKRKEGLGVGDMEFLAMIGSFLGPMGVWFSLFLGSVLGAIIGMTYISYYKRKRDLKIPFIPFLAFGAMVYFFVLKLVI